MDIRLDNVHFAYQEEGGDVLNGVTAAFRQEDITLLTGPSGCGKSTLLYLAAGLYPHHAGVLREGTVRIGEHDPAAMTAAERCRLAGMMFQNPDLQFCMDTVRNELIFCLENIGADPAEFEDRIREALEFCGIGHLAHRRIDSLSGGEKQRAMLACQFALGSQWLLLDEPFANVDDDAAAEIIDKLAELHRSRGVGILAVDHRPQCWLRAATAIREMDAGAVLPDAISPADFPEPEAYRRVVLPAGNAASSGTPVVLDLQDLSMAYVRRPREEDYVLRHLSMQFRTGESYAVIGGSGTGKSSLFGVLFGLHPYTGRILIDGQDLEKTRKKIFGQIGFVTQSPQDQFIGGTVRDEVLSALHALPAEEQARVSEEILRRIRLWRYRDISPYMLSQGQQRRLGVAALMAYPCRILICDEPTYAQDRANTVSIMDSLTEQVASSNVTLIFSTHDRELARAYADHVLELRDGQLREVAQ